MLFLYIGAALGLAGLQRWTQRQGALRLAPGFAGVALVIAQTQWQKRFWTPMALAMPTLWHPVWHKLKHAPYILMPAGDLAAHAAMVLLCFVAMATFAWLRLRERRASGPAPVGLRARAHAYRWEIFAAACFAAYLAFPLTL